MKHVKYSEKLEELVNDAKRTLILLVSVYGEESKFMNCDVLKLTKDNVMFNLSDTGRYVNEISDEHLIDNQGYLYNYEVLNAEQFLSLVDYFVNLY